MEVEKDRVGDGDGRKGVLGRKAWREGRERREMRNVGMVIVLFFDACGTCLLDEDER